MKPRTTFLERSQPPEPEEPHNIRLNMHDLNDILSARRLSLKIVTGKLTEYLHSMDKLTDKTGAAYRALNRLTKQYEQRRKQLQDDINGLEELIKDPRQTEIKGA